MTVVKRFGFPIASESRTVKLKAGQRTRFIVARFRDAGGGTVRLAASIAWSDGTYSAGAVLERGGGVYDVRTVKRYRRPGRYAVTVTVTDPAGRTSVARSAIVLHRPPR